MGSGRVGDCLVLMFQIVLSGSSTRPEREFVIRTSVSCVRG